MLTQGYYQNTNAATTVWYSKDGINWVAVVGLGLNADGTMADFKTVNYVNRKVLLGRWGVGSGHVPPDALNSAVKMASQTGTGFDEDITRVTLQDDTNLKYLLEGDTITGDTSGTVATIRDVNLDSNSIDCTDLVVTWQLGETVTGPVRRIRYCF